VELSAAARRVILIALVAAAPAAWATRPIFDGVPVGEGPDVGPMLISAVEPVVPDSLWPVLQDTVVVLLIAVSDSGTVELATYAEGESLLVAPSRAAVKQWRFTPALRGESPVKCVVAIPFPYRRTRPGQGYEFALPLPIERSESAPGSQ